jgi:UDP-N-acetylglucosamine:LPS N-acetylglucosamine transferase
MDGEAVELMKVLVVSVPGSGHLNPLFPLIEALIGGGDQVVVATGADNAETVRRRGASFYQAGGGEMGWFGQLQARIRGAPGDGLRPDRINQYFVPRLFCEIGAADMIDDVLACGRDLAPDLVMFETYSFAAPLAADLLGVPSVHHLLGPIPEPEVLELANDAVSPMWRSFGRDVPGHAGVYRDLTVEICPPSLESLEVPSGERMSIRPAPLPEAATAPTERPLIYITLGTFFNANLDIFRAALAGLASEPVEVVVTVGTNQDPDELGPAPSNARVERFIPQASLLPTCAAVVHHGGAGTTFGALAHGLPQVVIPQGADNFIMATMLERAGLADVLQPGEDSSDRIRDRVRRILEEPEYARAARRIAAEIAAMPGPKDVADSLRARFG